MNNDPHYSEHEDLDTKDRYNEYLLTSLRTMWGIDLDEIQQRYGVNYVKYTQGVADLFLRTGELMKNGSKIRLTKKGIFLADYVVREFFILDDLEKRN
jgi:oxygen-independent coproporphyrinogen-3 oxidase